MNAYTVIPHSRPWIAESDHHAVSSVLTGEQLAMGKLVSEFELQVAKYVGAKFSVAQASGTAALILALKALGISSGDEVVLPTYVCRSVLEAVLSVNAKPMICDVNEYGVLSKETVSSVFGKDTKAIIGVHIFGNLCDIASLKNFGVPIIEDACHAFGSLSPSGMAGTAGDVGIFSFHATKCLTTGEGGILVTGDAGLAQRARGIAFGEVLPNRRSVAPMSDLQAALGISQLSRFPQFVERRTALYQRYSIAAKKIGIKVGLDMHCHLPFRFILTSKGGFSNLQKNFFNNRISIRKGVDELLHRLVGLGDQAYPNAVTLINSTISVPFYPAITHEEADRIEKNFVLLL